MPASILLVDDDVELAELVGEYLRGSGLEVTAVHDGEAGLRAALSGTFDLVLLDVMMPKMDGFTVLKQLRDQSNIPVVMLTAIGDPKSRVDGLQGGADDYLPKPFDPGELLARIQAVLRRAKAPAFQGQGRFEVGKLLVDPGSRRVTRDDQLVDLTSVEYDILEMLMRNAGRVVSRDEIMQKLNQRPATPFDRSIDVHISHLRRKLDDDGARIITVRGVGYQFSSEAQP